MNNTKSMFKGISFKFLSVSLIIVFMAISAIGAISYYTQKSILKDMMLKQAKVKVEEIKNTIDDRESSVQITKEAINKYLVMINKMVERNIRNIPEEKLNQEIPKMCDYLGIPEIHVVDENGILQWTNIPDFEDYDFSESKQTRPFLKGLNNKNFILVQEPQKRGADKVLFQYCGVARQDKPGIVQIGIEPKELQQLIDNINIKHLAETATFGENGYICLTDKKGNIISNPNSDLLGKNITDLFSWGEKLINEKTGYKFYNLNGDEKFLYFSKYKDHIISATISTSEYYTNLNSFMNRLYLTSIIILLISTILVIIFTKRITDPIKELAKLIDRLAKYDLRFDENSKAVNYLDRKDEIGQITNSIATMQENFINLINQIKDISENVATSSEELSASGEQVGEAADQVGSAIQNVASGAEEQSAQIDETTKNIEEMIEQIKQVNTNTENMTESAENAMKK